MNNLGIFILCVTTVLITGIIAFACHDQAHLDATAPIVETCIKHPITRKPIASSP